MASSADFVLKAYKTEANARADSNSLAVTSAVAGVVDNPSQAAGYGFWAFQRYWYRIEANEPVTEFHIDWDDGEDNSPKKANVSIIKNDKPSFVGIVSHIYTQSKSFYPLIRVKSVEGFLSKWYTSYSTSNNYDGLDDDIKTDGYDKGQNSFSVVSIEKNDGSTAFARIPILKPANVPPVGVLKADRKRIFSSIDNDWLGNNGRLLNGLTAYGEMPNSSTITAQCSNNARVASQVKVTYQEGNIGGVSEVFSFKFNSKGSDASEAFNVTDLANKAIKIVTMDETYVLWINIGDQQGSISSISGVLGTYIPIIAIPTLSGGAGAGSLATVASCKDAVISALNTVIYPAPSDSGSRREFVATAVEYPTATWTITVTHNRKGAHEAAFLYHRSTDLPWMSTYGVDGISTSTQGVDASNGAVRQKTLTCDLSGVNDKIEKVSKVLRVELVNNLEATDSYGGSVNTDKLYPGERIYLQAGVSTASAATATFTFDTTATLNSEIELLDSDDVTRTYQYKDSTTSGTSDGGTRVLVDRGDNANDSADQLKIAIEHANGHNGTIKVDVENIHTHTHDTHHVQTGKVTLTQDEIGTDGNTTITLDAIDSAGFTDATSINPPAAFTGGAGAVDTAIPSSNMRKANLNINSTICSVSTGNPIMDLRSLGASVMIDATESKVRCSNNSIDSYYFDDNKLISGDSTVHSSGDFSRQNHQMADTTDASWGITDKIVDGVDSKSSLGTKELRYTHEWYRDHQDSNYRYYPIRRLVRTQIEDTHTQVADDSFSRSPIVHWDYSGYLNASAAGNSDAGQPSDVSNWNYGALLYTNMAQLRSPNWYDLKAENRGDMYPLFQCLESLSTADNLTYVLEPSTSFGATGYAPSNVGDAIGSELAGEPTDSTIAGPRNALFIARKEKFDRLFVRVSHDKLNAASLIAANMAADVTPGTTTGWPKIRIQVLYPAKKTTALDTIIWKTLPILDRTKIAEKDDSSFYLSGDITFTPPADWIKTSHSDNIEYPFEDNFFEDGSGTTGLNDVWNKDSYALVFLITNIAQGIEAQRSVFNIMSVYPYNNAHSQLIEVIDPMHISLNSYGIAQSVSFTRKGKYQEIKDRSGISLMRRIGAEGGNIKLGGIDLKSDPNTTRTKFYEFQSKANPLYFDITHVDDTVTRLFGVMTEMSEDHPTAKLIPKFACTMIITHILELDSSGNITGEGYKPMGGDAVDVERYLSTG